MLRALGVLALVGTIFAGFSPRQIGRGNAGHGFHSSSVVPFFAASFATTVTPEKGPAATFTRATASTRWVSGSGLATVSSGSAVIGCPEPSNSAPASNCTQGVYVGAAVTSLLTFTDDYSSAWSKSANITWTANTLDVTDPAGTHNALKAVCSSSCTTADFYAALVNVSVTGGQTNTMVVWLRGGSGGEVVDQNVNDGLNHITAKTLTTSWQRFVISVACGASTTNTPQLDVHTAGASTIYIYAPNFYNNLTFAPSVDPLQHASTGTVNADDLSYSGLVYDTSRWTVVAWGYIHGRGNNGQNYIASTDSGGGVSEIVPALSESGHLSLSCASCTGNATFGTAPANNTWAQAAFTIDSTANEVKGYLNGVQSGSTASVTAHFTVGAKTKFDVGRYSVGTVSDSNVTISNLRTYSRALTAGQILALYNSQSGTYALAPRNSLRDWLYAALPAPFAHAIAPTDAEIVRAAKWRVAHDPDLAAAWAQPEGG